MTKMLRRNWGFRICVLASLCLLVASVGMGWTVTVKKDVLNGYKQDDEERQAASR